jgi:glutaredoxin
MVSRLLRPLLLACLLGALAACTRGVPVDQTELRAAVGSEPVVLLSASWCGYCRKLRTDLKRWGVHFAEYDVEQSEAGARAFALLHGRGVPILLVGDTRSHGYVPNQVRKTLLAAGLLPANAPD